MRKDTEGQVLILYDKSMSQGFQILEMYSVSRLSLKQLEDKFFLEEKVKVVHTKFWSLCFLTVFKSAKDKDVRMTQIHINSVV